jgi:hypothetical protein
MHLISQPINNRKIFYTNIKDDLQELERFSLKNWVIFVIEDDILNPLLEPFANLCLDKSVLYMMATGKACSEVDDLFDDQFVSRQRRNLKLPYWYSSDDDVLMTAWNYSLDEAFWFITTTANYENYKIENVVVANFTRIDYLNQLEDLTKKIANGWLPSE